MKNKLRIGEGVEPCCKICANSAETDADVLFCKKKGIVDPSGSCGRYVYDPLKRVPAPRRFIERHDPSEFEL